MTRSRMATAGMLLAAPLLAALLQSCGSLPTGTSRNASICPEGSETFAVTPHAPPGLLQAQCVTPARAAAAASNPEVPRAAHSFTPATAPDVFIGLSISGGGSRAANFGWAVMEQLHEIGLLQHVSAISTTSGGGLAGAFYALNGPAWERGRELMATDFLGKWIASNLMPHHLLETTFTHSDRSDLMADIFDDVLFDKRTYAALGPFEPGRRPLWIANATDIGRAERFAFTGETFTTRLRSRLDSYPISRAVMASAAFPGAFNTVTLRNYLPHRVSSSHVWREPVTGYTHLIDGGPTDNLGLEALRVLASTHAQAKGLVGKPSGGCLLILADAFPQGIRDENTEKPDPRAWYDHVVDLNFLQAFDSLLARRRTDLLGYLGVGGRRTGGGKNVVTTAYIPMWRPGEEAPTSATPGRALRDAQDKWFMPSQRPDQFACLVWHINMSDTAAIPLYKGPAGAPPELDLNAFDLVEYRERLDAVTGQTSTSFRLTGPKGCSRETLRGALYAAAFALVREDHANRLSVCAWMKDRGLAMPEACTAFPGNRSRAIAGLEEVRLADDERDYSRIQHKTASCSR